MLTKGARGGGMSRRHAQCLSSALSIQSIAPGACLILSLPGRMDTVECSRPPDGLPVLPVVALKRRRRRRWLYMSFDALPSLDLRRLPLSSPLPFPYPFLFACVSLCIHLIAISLS